MTTPGEGYNSGVWSAEEHEAYLLAMRDFISWKDVAGRVGTRSINQCRSHDQKLRKKEVNRMEGRGRASRMEHRLLSDEARQVTPPTSPTGVDGSVIPPMPAAVSSSELGVTVDDPDEWTSVSVSSPILSSGPAATEENVSSLLDPYEVADGNLPLDLDFDVPDDWVPYDLDLLGLT